MRFALLIAAAAAVAACASACDSSSSNADAALIVSDDGAPKNACLAYGQGYVCQSGTVCSAGFVNKEDLDCAATGNVCCGPIGDGGATDANDDVNVFVDSAVFETGSADAAHEASAVVDSGHDATLVDGGHDATGSTSPDAASDASKHDANDATPHDAGEAGLEDAHTVIHDGSSDAKQG